MTGCSINPTRSFASAVAASSIPGCNVWDNHWVFWVHACDHFHDKCLVVRVPCVFCVSYVFFSTPISIRFRVVVSSIYFLNVLSCNVCEWPVARWVPCAVVPPPRLCTSMPSLTMARSSRALVTISPVCTRRPCNHGGDLRFNLYVYLSVDL